MKRDYGSVGTIALRASALLQAMSRDIEEQRKEFNLTEYHQTYTRNAVAKLPKLSRRIVELAVKEMEESGYEFNKKRVGNVEQYALTIQNVIDIERWGFKNRQHSNAGACTTSTSGFAAS